jgi:hypothetical protein
MAQKGFQSLKRTNKLDSIDILNLNSAFKELEPKKESCDHIFTTSYQIRSEKCTNSPGPKNTFKKNSYSRLVSWRWLPQ